MNRETRLCPNVLNGRCDGENESGICYCSVLHLEGTDCLGNECGNLDGEKVYCIQADMVLNIQDKIGRYK
jgi:hypothetical protein